MPWCFHLPLHLHRLQGSILTPPPALIMSSLCHWEKTRTAQEGFDSAASRFRGFYLFFQRGYSIRSRVLAANGTPTLPMSRHLLSWPVQLCVGGQSNKLSLRLFRHGPAPTPTALVYVARNGLLALQDIPSQEQLTSFKVDHSIHFLCLSPLSVHKFPILHIPGYLLACHQNSSHGRKVIVADTHRILCSPAPLFQFQWSVSISKGSITRGLKRYVNRNS